MGKNNFQTLSLSKSKPKRKTLTANQRRAKFCQKVQNGEDPWLINELRLLIEIPGHQIEEFLEYAKNIDF